VTPNLPTTSENAGQYYPPAPPQGPTLMHILRKQRRAVRRRLVPMLVAAAAVMAFAIAAATLWPATYRSTGTILIEQQEIPEEFVRSAVTSYADQRVQVISQRVMTSANLIEIISKYNLYPDDRRSKAREAILAAMREDIKLNMISADVVDPRLGRATKATIAFSVSFESRSPQIAAAVANELTSLYLRENLDTRKQQAAGTAEFLTTESSRLRGLVTALEEKISAFKTEHESALPEFTQLNMQLASRALDDMRDLDGRVRSLDQQIVYLESQLVQINPTSLLYGDTGQRVMGTTDQLKMLKSQYAAASATYSPDHPDVIRLKRQIEGIEKELGGQSEYRDTLRNLDQARTDLAAMSQTRTAEHPDVLRLRKQVAEYEARLATIPRTVAAPGKNEQPDNPAYVQIQANLRAAQSERTSLITQRSQLRERQAELEQRGAAAPGVERDYAALVRELQGAQLKYNEVQQKQMEATLASNLETDRKGERFTLIEPPLEAQKPVSPNRVLILLLGALLAAGTGVGIMLLLEALDTRVRGRDDIISLLKVPPLAVIPWIEPA
jgi:succinoglycan biosynthesis transport protein ExoP